MQEARKFAGVLFAAIVGIAAFWAWTRFVVVDPNNLLWLTKSNADPLLYTLTWWFFRDSPWMFPLGLNPDYGIEFQSSIALTDTLPLFALPLKLLRPILPEIQQYWGIWLLLCVVLQAVFAYLLARALRASMPIALILAGFLCFATPMLFQAEDHLALAAQWLILAALWLYVLSPRRHWPWVLLLTLASLIQPYLLAMSGAIWIASVVQRARLGHQQLPLVGELVVGLALPITVLWAVGLFVLPSLGTWGLGVYRFNILSFIDPDKWSRLASDIPGGFGDYEGFAYLGMGILALIFIVLIRLVLNPQPRPKAVIWAPLIVILVGLLLMSLSPDVALGPFEILSLPLPPFVERLWSMFRTTGRMIWPVYYFIIVVVVIYCGRVFRPATAVAVAGAALALQLFDTSAGWGAYYPRRAETGTSFPAQLVSPVWDALAERYPRIREVPVWENGEHWWPISLMAATRGMATDSVYGGRIDHRVWREMDDKSFAAVTTGSFDEDAVYVIGNPFARWASRQAGPDDLFGTIDGLLVFAPGGAGLGTAEPYDPTAPVLPVGVIDLAESDAAQPYLTGTWVKYWRGGAIAARQRAGIQFSAPGLGEGAKLVMMLRSNTRAAFVPQEVTIYTNGVSIGTLTIPEGRRVVLDIPLVAHPDGNYLIDFEISEAAGPDILHPVRDFAPVGLILQRLELVDGPAPASP